jgi:tetratricopeptide (TPR) repeat protein
MNSAVSIFVLGALLAVWAAQKNSSPVSEPQPRQDHSSESETELQTGIGLTRSGNFVGAIPHLLAARGHVSDDYAAGFDLALCYVGTRQFKDAIQVLTGLAGGSHDADVYNLLAQASVGDGQPQQALINLKKAAALTPQNEKLYLFVADACMDNHYGLGLKVVDLGLRNLPQSSRLHYQRAMFFALVDQLDIAKQDFELAAKLEPRSDIAYIAKAQEHLFTGNIPDAIRVAREGVKSGYGSAVLLTILGEALIRSGLVPGQPDFSEAEAALEKSVADRPNHAGAQIALGKLYLMENRLDKAIAHLEAGRQLEPSNPSSYSNLATAYRRRGNLEQAQQILMLLSDLNQQQEARITAAPGDRQASYDHEKIK